MNERVEKRCTIDGCTGRYRSRGRCSAHLRQAKAAGEELPDFRDSEHFDKTEVRCRVEGCTSPSKYRGQALCNAHYLRRYHHGTFVLPEKPTLEDLLYANFDEDESDCWLWTGPISTSGYGRIGSLYAHRVSFEIHVRPIPAGHQIDHLCRVTRCVNPDHLEAVSQLENLRRQREKIAIEKRSAA